jgi:hypothetical protein
MLLLFAALLMLSCSTARIKAVGLDEPIFERLTFAIDPSKWGEGARPEYIEVIIMAALSCCC